MKKYLFALLVTGVTAIQPLSAQTGEGKIKLMEAYDPKPSGEPPQGWEIQMLEASSIESKTRLNNGREIKVTAPAYEIVPIKGGVTIRDPKFDPMEANAQKKTIGALLTKYSEVAENLQKELEATLGELDKALGPETKREGAQAAPTPTPAAAQPEKKAEDVKKKKNP